LGKFPGVSLFPKFRVLFHIGGVKYLITWGNRKGTCGGTLGRPGLKGKSPLNLSEGSETPYVLRAKMGWGQRTLGGEKPF